jgi:hypothetical protein
MMMTLAGEIERGRRGARTALVELTVGSGDYDRIKTENEVVAAFHSGDCPSPQRRTSNRRRYGNRRPPRFVRSE